MSQVAIQKLKPAEPAAASLLQEVESVLSRIKDRAFELFRQRGATLGKEVEDWLQAERQIVFAPLSEMLETETVLEIKIAVPGFAPEQLKVNVLPEYIVVSGKAEATEEKKEGKLHFSEFSRRDMLRQFALPTPIEPEHAHATLQKGILTIAATKAAQVLPKPVAVETAEEKKSTVAAAG